MVYFAVYRTLNGEIHYVRARKYAHHATHAQAYRALQRVSRRSKVDLIGYVWPAVDNLAIDAVLLSPLPVYVETISL